MSISCGSGVTACVLTFGLHLLGKPLDKYVSIALCFLMWLWEPTN